MNTPEGRQPAITVSSLDPIGDATAWDAFLATHPDATVFHGSLWARLLSETYGLKPHYLVARQGGDIVGALPLFETGGGWRARRGVSVPFADICPPLLPSVDAATESGGASSASPLSSLPPEGIPSARTHPAHPDATSANLDSLAAGNPLLAVALELGRRRGWRSLEFRDVPDWAAKAGTSVEFYGHTIDLEGGDSAVLDRMSSAAARSTRKSERSDLKILVDNGLDAVRAYYRLHCLTRKRHGQPPQPWGFFAGIQRCLLGPGHGFVVLALKDERPIAGAVYLLQGVGALYKFGASDENYQALRPNNRVFWEAIKICIRRGCMRLDLGRTSLANEGLRRFKLGWGSLERRIGYLRYDLRTRQTVPTPDATTGWHTRVFQALPIPVARFLGRIAYRSAA